ncbi:DUF6346 domain-containing protein [Gandjariella thermophila]|uniref:Uncharacterized protein n=1 Tax=Gandjariella thermophila TaxID=1931992 RepID=A0A4D4JBB7_9PSEU|nr:DUF6346 domain-containing protein [Gandjariella thermophila]GDY32864.1 hypothetical protein GTS_44970 [Gandjariella thermophila]
MTERSTRESRLWPVPVFTLLFLVVAGIVAFGSSFRLGLSPSGPVLDRGVAEVRSCRTSVPDLGLASVCQAQVRWQSGRSGHAVVRSVRPLTGTVDVVERGRRGGRNPDAAVVPADHPDHAASWAWGLLVLGVLACGAGGMVLGFRVSRWLPPRRRSPLGQ